MGAVGDRLGCTKKRRGAVMIPARCPFDLEHLYLKAQKQGYRVLGRHK